MNEFRILVTATGGAMAPSNIKLMKTGSRHDVWVAAVDTRDDIPARYFADAFAVVPNGDDPAYSDAIADLVREFGIDLVLPWSDEEALSLSKARESIEHAGAILACAKHETLEIMNDKAASYELLGKAGLALPDWRMARSEADLKETVAEFYETHGEFVVKPVIARGNRGTFIIQEMQGEAERYLDSRELHLNFDEFMRSYFEVAASELPAMIMERLDAPAYDIDVLAQNGKLLRAMPRERLNPAGVPFTGGILRPTAQLLKLAEDVTQALRLDWLYDYDLMTRKNGEPVVIELNPRPSGSIAAAILAGVPFYDDLISLAKGDIIPEVPQPEPVAVIPYLECKLTPISSLR